MLVHLKEGERLPEELLADTAYDGDENVQAAAALGVDLVGPVPGRAPVADPGAMTVDDFAVDEPHRQCRRLPGGPSADVSVQRRRDGDDAGRDAGVGLRRVPVSHAMSDQE